MEPELYQIRACQVGLLMGGTTEPFVLRERKQKKELRQKTEQQFREAIYVC